MKILLLVATAALVSPVAAVAETLPPRDECAADGSFAAFRTSLHQIIRRKDAKALLAVTAPEIEWSFGTGNPGKAGFVEQWELGSPGQANIWPELDAALSLGCALDQGQATAPYMSARLPQSRDPAKTMLPNRPRVNLRAAPNTDSAVVALLAWDILTVIDEDDSSWTHVKADDGREGYVRVDFLRSPVAYRAIFAKRGGKWLMMAFYDGD